MQVMRLVLSKYFVFKLHGTTNVRKKKFTSLNINTLKNFFSIKNIQIRILYKYKYVFLKLYIMYHMNNNELFFDNTSDQYCDYINYKLQTCN